MVTGDNVEGKDAIVRPFIDQNRKKNVAVNDTRYQDVVNVVAFR